MDDQPPFIGPASRAAQGDSPKDVTLLEGRDLAWDVSRKGNVSLCAVRASPTPSRRGRSGCLTIKQMQIRTADRRTRDPQDRIFLPCDTGHGNL